MCWKILWQNIHISLSRWQDITNVQKIMPQNVQISLKSQLNNRKHVGKNPVTKRPHVAKQLAGHHKWVQKFCGKPSKFRFRKGWTWCHRAFWGGWALCHKWQTVQLEAGVDKKYVDGSYRWTNVTVVNCHSRQFVGWTLSLGQIVTWSVCGWTDRQGTYTAGYVTCYTVGYVTCNTVGYVTCCTVGYVTCYTVGYVT